MSDSLFTELKRRNVFKVGIAYLVLAWVVVQITDTAVPALHLPEWIITAVFFFGAIGFPFAVFFAWAFEITPEGMKKESEIAPEDSITAHTGRKLDFIIIGLLVLVAGYFIYESRFEPEVESPKEVVQKSEGSSIAVLPFVNMSSDPEQEYFSDGISEEILNVLAKIPNLHVTSRSSAFAFKDSKINISEVATKLGVKNVLEGSVRKSGNRIRITAQLIEAGSDKHLWSETYDRKLTDIFAIQDEISLAIVDALKSKLGLDTQLASRDMNEVNLDAHNEYLQGRFYVEKRTLRDLEKALEHFENAIEIDQNYAPAWMGKAMASLFLSEDHYGNILPDIAISNARPAAEKALALDATLAESYAIMGIIEATDKDNEKAIVNYQKAIVLNPNYADAYNWYSRADGGKSLELKEKAVRLDPMSIVINVGYGDLLRRTLQFDKATEVAQHILDIDASSHFAYSLLRNISFDEGKKGEALFYHAKAVSLNSTRLTRYGLYNDYLSYGLKKESVEIWKNKPEYETEKAFVSKDFKTVLRLDKLIYPRNENDKEGAEQLAASEMRVGNFEEATKYFKMAEELDNSDVVYVYQQLGDDVAADAIIDKWKISYEARVKSGREDIYWWAARIAFAENDIDEMFKQLTLRLNEQDDYIIGFEYTHEPKYQILWDHPQWKSILAESDKRAKKVRDEYYKFADRDAEVVAREHTSEKSTERIEITVASGILEEYVGVYVLTPEFSVTVTFDDGYLFLQGTDQGKAKVAPESESKFFSLSHNDKFSFQRDEKGTVVSLIEHDKTFNQKYMKVK